MNIYFGVAVLVFVLGWNVAQKDGAKSFEPQALAAVAKHQLAQMQIHPRQLVCLSLPNYQDPDRSSLRQINRHDLHLRPGSECWKPPKGFLLLVNNYQQSDRTNIEIKIEVDDMNLNGAHVVTRLREATYRVRAEGQHWRVESYQARDL
jgi:hypothetical protein